MSEPFAEYYYPELSESEKPPQILAYGFRPIFFIMPLYTAFSIVLWAFIWIGFFPMGWLEQPLHWHIFEMLFGMGSAALIGFLLTAIPELFLGVYPVIGKRLLYIIILWGLGRVTFWSMALTGIFTAAVFNIALLVWLLLIAFKPIFIHDSQRNHVSIAFTLAAIISSEIIFFAAKLGWMQIDPIRVLKLAIGFFMILILVALRRINTEAVNFYIEDKGVDEVFYARPFRYNTAILSVFLFTVLEFFDFQNSALAWLALAAMAAILGVLSDYRLKDYFILHYSYVIYLASILLVMAAGYGFIGYAYLQGDLFISHYRHFLTSGALGLAVFLAMSVIAQIHTGRKLQPKLGISVGVVLIVTATILRVAVKFYPAQQTILYASAGVLWGTAFVIYFFMFKTILFAPRADGLPG